VEAAARAALAPLRCPHDTDRVSDVPAHGTPPRIDPSRIALALALPPTAILVGGLLADWWWIGDLMSHFRWHALLSLALLLAIPLAQRRWRHALVLAAPTLLATTLVAPYLLWGGPARTADNEEPLRIALLNRQHDTRDHAAVITWLDASGADLAILLEVDHAWWAALEDLPAWPQRAGVPRADAFGIAVLASRPGHAVRVLYPGTLGIPSLELRLELDGHDLRLIATHPLPPMSAANQEARNRQMRAVATLLGKHEGARVLVGDLNATPYSPTSASGAVAPGWPTVHASGSRPVPGPRRWGPWAFPSTTSWSRANSP